MTKEEWAEAVTKEFRDAGFTVTDLQGIPLVKVGTDFDENLRFLKFRPQIAVDKRMYAEGCLLLPAGMNLEMSKREAANE